MIIFFSKWFVNSYGYIENDYQEWILHHGKMKGYAYSEIKIPLASEYILLHHPIFYSVAILLPTLYKYAF